MKLEAALCRTDIGTETAIFSILKNKVKTQFQFVLLNF